MNTLITTQGYVISEDVPLVRPKLMNRRVQSLGYGANDKNKQTEQRSPVTADRELDDAEETREDKMEVGSGTRRSSRRRNQSDDAAVRGDDNKGRSASVTPRRRYRDIAPTPETATLKSGVSVPSVSKESYVPADEQPDDEMAMGFSEPRQRGRSVEPQSSRLAHYSSTISSTARSASRGRGPPLHPVASPVGILKSSASKHSDTITDNTGVSTATGVVVDRALKTIENWRALSEMNFKANPSTDNMECNFNNEGANVDLRQAPSPTASTINPDSDRAQTLRAREQELERKEKARLRVMKYMQEVDSRVCQRRGGQSMMRVYSAGANNVEGGSAKPPRPWEVERMDRRHSFGGRLSDERPDKGMGDKKQLMIPSLLEKEDESNNSSTIFRGIQEDEAPLPPPTNASHDAVVESLQSRLEYYKFQFKNNEKQMRKLQFDLEHATNKQQIQQQRHEEEQKEGAKAREEEMEQFRLAMEEAENAVKALESTIEELNQVSREKESSIHDLETSLELLEKELEECRQSNDERLLGYEEHVKALKEGIACLEAMLKTKDASIMNLEGRVQELESDLECVMGDLVRIKEELAEANASLAEKDQLLNDGQQEVDAAKCKLVEQFEEYRVDLSSKLEATNLHIEAITKEKDSLIQSLNEKVSFLESCLDEKETELENHDDCAKKNDELKEKMHTLAIALTEKDRLIHSFQFQQRLDIPPRGYSHRVISPRVPKFYDFHEFSSISESPRSIHERLEYLEDFEPRASTRRRSSRRRQSSGKPPKSRSSSRRRYRDAVPITPESSYHDARDCCDDNERELSSDSFSKEDSIFDFA